MYILYIARGTSNTKNLTFHSHLCESTFCWGGGGVWFTGCGGGGWLITTGFRSSSIKTLWSTFFEVNCPYAIFRLDFLNDNFWKFFFQILFFQSTEIGEKYRSIRVVISRGCIVKKAWKVLVAEISLSTVEIGNNGPILNGRYFRIGLSVTKSLNLVISQFC